MAQPNHAKTKTPRRFRKDGHFFVASNGTLVYFGDEDAYQRFEADPRDNEPAADLKKVLAMIEITDGVDLTPNEAQWVAQALTAYSEV